MNLLDTDNILNSKTSIGKEMRDGIGLGMSKTNMLKFKLGEFPVNGILCSANDIEGWVRPKSDSLKCEDVPFANELFAGELMVMKKVFCPPNCAKEKDAVVYGSTKFHEKSSVCRAALYADITSDTEGGEVYIQMDKDASSYDAGFSNGIEVLELAQHSPTDRSFLLSVVIYPCPIEKYTDSFI